MTQPPGPDDSTGPAQPSEPADPGQQRETASPEEATPPATPPPAPPATEPAVPPTVPPTAALPAIRPPVPGGTAAGAVPQPGYPQYPGQAAPGGYPPYPGGHYPGGPQYPAGGYDQSQPYPAQYDPSQPYVIYQPVPTGGVLHGHIGEGDPLISPDYSGWWRRAIAVVKQAWRSLAVLQIIGFLVSLLFSVPQVLIVLNLTDEVVAARATIDANTGEPVLPDLGPTFAVLGLTLLGALLAIMVNAAVAIACNHVAVSVAAGLQPRIGLALGLAARRVFPMIGWLFLAALIMLGGICACVVPSIYLGAVFALLPVVVTFERGGSAISRCFKLFHQDLGVSISRIATIAGISIGVGVVAYIINIVIELVPGAPTFDQTSTSVFGSVNTEYAIAVLLGTVVADLMARAAAVFTTPLTLGAYADLRARAEPLTTATLANEAGLTPAYLHQGGEETVEPLPGQEPSSPDSDWMPPNR